MPPCGGLRPPLSGLWTLLGGLQPPSRGHRPLSGSKLLSVFKYFFVLSISQPPDELGINFFFPGKIITRAMEVEGGGPVARSRVAAFISHDDRAICSSYLVLTVST